jgi:hypothetical protein
LQHQEFPVPDTQEAQRRIADRPGQDYINASADDIVNLPG